MEGKEEQRKLRELINEIPLEHFFLTQELVEYIKSQISNKLNESLLITLADHISFAIQRKEKGIEYRNPLSGPVMCYYPQEYRVGKVCLQMIEEKCKIRLNPDEATFIALHIVNAEFNTKMSQMYDMTRMLDGCIRTAENYYQKKWNEDSVDLSRFVVHLRYMIWRLFKEKEQDNKKEEQDILFRQIIQRNCARHYQCALDIAAYIQNEYGKQIPEEELVYMTIHLKRLNMEED